MEAITKSWQAAYLSHGQAHVCHNRYFDEWGSDRIHFQNAGAYQDYYDDDLCQGESN